VGVWRLIRLSPAGRDGKACDFRFVIAGLDSAIQTAIRLLNQDAHFLPESYLQFSALCPSGHLMKKQRPSPRGRFVGAHMRRSLTKPGDYFNVTDYQEKFDRLRTRLKHFALPQLRLPFSMPQQSQPEDPDDPDPATQKG
jgi:hypothetical protein